MNSDDIITLAAALFAICNPIGNLAIFISLTKGQTALESRKTATRTALAVLIILVVVIWIGQPLLHALGITIPVLGGAGGVIIFLIGLSMLKSETSKIHYTDDEHKEAKQQDSVAVVPLALPILAGPGTMSMLLVATHAHPGLESKVLVSGMIVILSLVLGAVFRFATPISKLIGAAGIKIVSRIMGLVLTCIGFGMITSSLKTIFHF